MAMGFEEHTPVAAGFEEHTVAGVLIGASRRRRP
jgi:hypothetical protein